MGLFSFTLPRQFHRLTLKFVLEVAFSVAVTLAATKVIGLVMASPEVPKASKRAEVPSAIGVPAASPALTQTGSSQATPSPDMTRFMEKTALAHVAVPWAEDVVTAAPVRAAILTSAPRSAASPHGSLVAVAPLPPERPSAKILASLGTPSVGPVLPTPLASNLVAVANSVPRAEAAATRPPAQPPLGPVASVSNASTVPRPPVDIPRPPADISGRKPKPQKSLLARADDVKSSIVDSVSSVGSSIGNSIGSLFKRN